MMKPRFIFLLLIAVVSADAFSQEFNRIDDKGRKQGPFKKYFESEKSKVFYEGQFKDDIPFGRFTYYHKNGKVKSFMDHDGKGLVARAEVFLDDGIPLAKGKYINKLKDSTWVYFDGNTAIGFDNWIDGKKNGLEVVFFNGRDTSEVISWRNDKMNGPWRQYFPDGNLKLKTTMIEDEYDGVTEFYHNNGKLNITGKYANGFRNGSWYYYNYDGSLQMQVLYRGGKVIKEKRENGKFTEYFGPEMPESEITYKNGKKHGPFVIYHDSATRVKVEEKDEFTGEVIPKEVVKGVQAKMVGEYRNDKLHGPVKHYNEAGRLIKTETFENGDLVKK
ncbi:MAG: hypothetical protein HKN39_02945 [Flavobacteriales bacterium]|nr:hypothetical protein [Flavobacteriales bacterium]